MDHSTAVPIDDEVALRLPGRRLGPRGAGPDREGPARFGRAAPRLEDVRQNREDAGLHTLGAIWRRGRLTCPTRQQLGSLLLDALDPELASYIQFHLDVVACPFCQANLADLKARTAQPASAAQGRRNRILTSSQTPARRRSESLKSVIDLIRSLVTPFSTPASFADILFRRRTDLDPIQSESPPSGPGALPMSRPSRFLALVFALGLAIDGQAQTPATPSSPPPSSADPSLPAPGSRGNADNVPFIGRRDPTGNTVRLAKASGHVSNYNEEKVAPYTLPDPLVTNSGERIDSAEGWFKKRRPEILKFYQDEIYGRVPVSAPG